MIDEGKCAARALVVAVAGLATTALAISARAADYQPITPSMADQTITLNGHDLTIDQIVNVARYGAKVAIAPEARQREADDYGLLLEASAEGIPVYWFNRGAGD